MNLAIKLFKDCPHRNEYAKGIPLDWIAEVIEKCSIPPDDKYIIMSRTEYDKYIEDKLPYYTEWEVLQDLENKKLQDKINACLDLYNSFPKGLQVQFKDIKKTVIDCITMNDLQTAKDIINTISLPIELNEVRVMFLDMLN